MIDGTAEAPVTETGAAPESSTGAEAQPSETTEQAGTASNAGPDSGSVNGQEARQRGKSVYSQVRELSAKLRDQRGYWESEVGTLKQQLEELRTQIGQGRPAQKQSKTFWEAPEEALDERLTSHLSEFEKRMASKFEQTQVQREAATIRQQELSEAAKFIKTQKGMTEEDIQDIREILASNPDLENLPPMKQAKYALYEWRESRGITDNSAQKAKASTVTGFPPSAGGKRSWTESDMEKEISKLPPNPKDWTDDQKKQFDALNREFESAYKENRVNK